MAAAPQSSITRALPASQAFGRTRRRPGAWRSRNVAMPPSPTAGGMCPDAFWPFSDAMVAGRSARRLHVLRGHVADVRREEPLVPLGVLGAVAAVAVELVRRLVDDLRAGLLRA